MKLWSSVVSVLDRIAIKDAIFAFSIGGIEWNMSFAINESNLVDKEDTEGLVVLGTTQAEKADIPFGFTIPSTDEEDEE